MTDYSFETCKRTHPPRSQELIDLDIPQDVWEHIYHDWVCLAFDRQYEFQLRAK